MNLHGPCRQEARLEISPRQGRAIGKPSSVLPAARRPQPGRKSLLLVEPRDEDALVVKGTLRTAGIAMPIRIAQDLGVARAYLQGDSPFEDRVRYPLPSILMFQVRSAKKSGFDFLRWIRAQPRFRDIFLVVFVDGRKVGNIAQACRLGADWFFTKPCRVEDIRKLAQSFPGYWSVSSRIA